MFLKPKIKKIGTFIKDSVLVGELIAQDCVLVEALIVYEIMS